MSSKTNALQEFQFLETSSNRKKVDIHGFRLMEVSKNASWPREEEIKPDESESKYDLRKSLAWDTAFFTSAGVFDLEELFETLNIHNGDSGIKEVSCLLSESLPASGMGGDGDFFARRSLAWDAAFFTNAGVLNPEELSMVNSGYKASETLKQIPPGIEEGILKSAESKSIMDTDYSLASLEIDLLKDMKASMQKSSKASDVGNSSCNFQCQKGMPTSHSSKRQESVSNRIKPLPGSSRRTKGSAHGVAKSIKEAINPSQQHCSRKPNSSSSLKPLKASVSSSATKKPLSAATNIKVNNQIRKDLIGQNMSTCFGDSSSFIPGSTDKSPSSWKRNNSLDASDSNARTTSRYLTSHRSKLIYSSQLTDLQSTRKSSSTTLSNSTDCRSSESSASVNHNSRKSPNSVFSRGVPINNAAPSRVR